MSRKITLSTDLSTAPLSTDLSKIPSCQAAVLPSSGYRDTKPLVTSVLIRAPLSVTPVTCARGLRLAPRCDGEHTIPVNRGTKSQVSNRARPEAPGGLRLLGEFVNPGGQLYCCNRLFLNAGRPSIIKGGPAS